MVRSLVGRSAFFFFPLPVGRNQGGEEESLKDLSERKSI